MWFRLSMNYNSQPIFKEEELRAVFHPNRSVRYSILLERGHLLNQRRLVTIIQRTIVIHPRNLLGQHFCSYFKAGGGGVTRG